MASREIHSHVMRLLRPLANRVANTIIRSVVQLVDDAKKLQLLQVGANDEIDAESAEHHQPYGFSSVPLDGAEAVLLFPNGDQAHPLAIAVSDRRYRPTGGERGEVCMYTDEGDVIRLGRGHVITVATSGTVKLGGSSATQAVVVQSALDLFMEALTNAVNSTVLAPGAMAPGKAALATLLAALSTGVCPPASPITELAGGWTAGTDKTKAE